MEMKKVLKVILIRSGILLSLLVVLIMAIKTLVEHEPPGESQQKRILAVLGGEQIQEHNLLIKGIKDGMVFNGLKYATKIYVLPSLIQEASLVCCIDPCLAEEVVEQRELKYFNRMIGYSYINYPKENYTGIYCGLDWKKVFPLYQKILPGMRRLGVIYTQGSCDGEKQASALKAVAQMRPQMSVHIKTIDHFGEDVEKIMLELLASVDAIYAVSRDKIIQVHLETIAQLCLKHKIPLIGGGVFGAQNGAVASVAHDPYRVGRKCSDIIRILDQGKNISEMEVVRIEPELYINLTSAYSIGLDIPSDIRKNAKKIFD